MFKRFALILITIFSLTVLLSSCGGGSDKDKNPVNPDDNDPVTSTVNIGGTIGASYKVPYVKNEIISYSTMQKGTETGAFVDTVMAVPINHPFVAGEYIMKEAVTEKINPGGHFQITLDKERDWILMLIDSTKGNRKDQLVSFAALGDSAGGDSMMLIPAGNTVSDIEMGTLDASGDEAVQADALETNADKFNLKLSDLRQIAQNDNLLKTIKNIYVNYDPVTEKFYSVLMSFCWGADGMLSKNRFSAPADYNFIGYQPAFNSRNDTTFPYEGVKNKDFIISIVPPESVTDSIGITYTSFDNNCELTETFWSEKSFYVGSNNPPFAFGIDYTYDEIGWIQTGAGGCRFTNLVEGWWSIQKDGVEKAAFDLAVSSPLDPVTGMPSVFLPSVKFNVDQSNIITSIEIKWYIYNQESGVYEEITDVSGFANLIEVAGLCLVDLDNPRHEERHSIDISAPVATVYPEAKTWELADNPAAPYELFYMNVFYRIYGVDCVIDVRP